MQLWFIYVIENNIKIVKTNNFEERGTSSGSRFPRWNHYEGLYLFSYYCFCLFRHLFVLLSYYSYIFTLLVSKKVFIYTYTNLPLLPLSILTILSHRIFFVWGGSIAHKRLYSSQVFLIIMDQFKLACLDVFPCLLYMIILICPNASVCLLYLLLLMSTFQFSTP